MKSFLIIIVIVGATIGILLIDELNRTAIFMSDGYIDEGSKFGIEIGMDENTARNLLKSRGFRMVEKIDTPGTCHLRKYPSGQELEVWYDDTWRSGTICLASKGGKVKSLGWDYVTFLFG